MSVATLPPRVSAKIRLDDPPPGRPVIGPCWTWTAGRTTAGYGNTHIGGGTHLAHRYTYGIFIGAIPAGLEVDHLCRNRACCNPCHLEAVTRKVNAERGMQAQQTHCKNGHEFTGHNVMRKKSNGVRQCRACHRETQRLRRLSPIELSEADPRHGTRNAYNAYGCRCDPCREACAAYWKLRKQRGWVRRTPEQKTAAVSQ